MDAIYIILNLTNLTGKMPLIRMNSTCPEHQQNPKAENCGSGHFVFPLRGEIWRRAASLSMLDAMCVSMWDMGALKRPFEVKLTHALLVLFNMMEKPLKMASVTQ